MAYYVFQVSDLSVYGKQRKAIEVFNFLVRDNNAWGFGKYTPNRKAIKADDRVLFYIVGQSNQTFVGSAVLKSGAYENRNPKDQNIFLDPETLGYIDLLARDPKGNFVVIELKKGRKDDEVMGQVLRYMGWVRKNLCKKNEEVRGLIVVGERDKKLQYALEEIGAKVTAMIYQVSFKLNKF
jgi:hypothetical protein